MSTVSPVPERGPLDEAGRLARALPCGRCGYELRGLAPDAGCPECGHAIAESLAADEMRQAYAWKGRLTRKLVLGGVLLSLAAGPVWVLSEMIFGGGTVSATVGLLGFGLALATVLAIILALLGAWFSPRYRAAQRVLGALLGMGLAAGLLFALYAALLGMALSGVK